MKKYAFGVDVGGTTVKLGLFTVQGELLEDWEIPTVKADGGRMILPDVSRAVLAKISEKDLDKGDIEGIGIGLPGPVLEDGTVLGAANLGWGEFNVSDALSELTGLKVRAGNDANVAALGEMWKGGGKGCSDMVMVTLGTGVGGGIIINGRIVTGRNGAAGEIGHIPVAEPEDEPEECGCGKHGCLEQYASATGAVRLAGRFLEENKEINTILRDKELTAKSIFDAAAAGDGAALAITDRFCRILGKALAAVAAALDPEMFVIGGGVSKAGEILTDGIGKYYREYAFHAVRGAGFALASLGNRAGMYGAVKLLIG